MSSLFPPIYSYAWALGHGVALANLTNVENDVNPYNARTSGGPTKRLGIVSQPVDEFPARTLLASGRTRGDGIPTHAWRMTLATYGYKRILDTYFASAASVGVAMTINTRIHRLGSYKRYNVYAILPSQANGTENHIRANVWEVTFEFTLIAAL